MDTRHLKDHEIHTILLIIRDRTWRTNKKTTHSATFRKSQGPQGCTIYIFVECKMSCSIFAFLCFKLNHLGCDLFTFIWHHDGSGLLGLHSRGYTDGFTAYFKRGDLYSQFQCVWLEIVTLHKKKAIVISGLIIYLIKWKLIKFHSEKG